MVTDSSSSVALQAPKRAAARSPQRSGMRPEAVTLSDISPAQLARAIADLRGAQLRLAARPRREIVGALSDVVDAWLEPDSPWLARAEAWLPRATGLSPAMIRHALPTMLQPLRAPALDELLAAEVGNRRGPPLILHVL